MKVRKAKSKRRLDLRREIRELERAQKAQKALRPMVEGASAALAETLGVSDPSARMITSMLIGMMAPVAVEVEGQAPVRVTRDDATVIAVEAMGDIARAYLPQRSGK